MEPVEVVEEVGDADGPQATLLGLHRRLGDRVRLRRARTRSHECTGGQPQ
jgi:hypothetical protein